MKKVRCVDNQHWGKTLTIGKVYDIIEESYRFYRIIDDEGNSYVYLKDRFEIEVKEMKKQDLENGMVVEFREVSIGKFAIVVGNILFDLDCYINLNDYNDNLINKTDKEFDIIAVYKPKVYGCGLNNILSGNDLELLWKRKEENEYTIKELEKLTGIKNLKIVKEDK